VWLHQNGAGNSAVSVLGTPWAASLIFINVGINHRAAYFLIE